MAKHRIECVDRAVARASRPCLRCTNTGGTPVPQGWRWALGAGQRGFTLAEVTVVIAIIVLLLAMAVPAFNYITSNRSAEAAQNQIAGMLARARAEAIYRNGQALAGGKFVTGVGVAFFVDTATARMTTAIISADDQTTAAVDVVMDNTGATPPTPLYESQTLPNGVGIQLVNDATNLYSRVGDTDTSIAGPRAAVVLFDGQGRLVSKSYTIAANSYLAGRMNTGAPTGTLVSQFGGGIYDTKGYDNQTTATDKDNWLKDNALPFLVNRYNGTLLKSE